MLFIGSLNDNCSFFLSCSAGVLTDAELTRLSSELGHEWQMLLVSLGVAYSRLQQIEGSYPGRVAMQIFASLWHWREYSEGDERSKLHTLVNVLQRNYKADLAERMDGLSSKYEFNSFGGWHRRVWPLAV